MDEILIRIDVESDPAVVGIEKVERALHNLDDEQGRVAKSAEKYHRDDMGRFKAVEKAQVSELDRYKTGAKTISEYRRQIEELTGAEIKRRSKLSEAAKAEPAEIMKVYQTLEQVQKLRAQMAQEVQGQTGKTIAEITRMGKTIEAVAKQQKKADDAAILSAQRISDQRNRIDKAYNDSSIKRTRERLNAQDRMEKEFAARAEPFMKARNARFERQAQPFVSTLGSSIAPGQGQDSTMAGLNMRRAAHRAMQKADEDAYNESHQLRVKAEQDEKEILERRKARWKGFFESIASGGKRGGGFRKGGTRLSQFSDNPFLDTGGRGVQPRNLGIAGAVFGAGALAGPAGVALGGLAGAVPGAVAGVAAAIAAIKMSGLAQVADKAAKIRDLQAQITTGAIAEEKGRAKINAILLQMTPQQKQALTLWTSFHKVTEQIGQQVSDVMLPAIGQLGKALGSNSGTLTRSVVTAGRAMANTITDLSKFISSGPGKALFAGTTSSGNTFITGLMQSVTDLGKTFLGVGNASQKFMRQIMGAINGATGALANWSTSFDGQNSMKGFFDKAFDELKRIVALAKSLGAVLITIFAAALPYSDRLIDGITSVLKHFNTFLKSSRGQNDMKELFDTITVAVKSFALGVQSVWPIAAKVFQGIIGFIQTMDDHFGRAGAIIVVFSALLLKSLMPVLAQLAAKEAGMALLNPWVAATLGLTVLVGFIVTAERAMDSLKRHAEDTAAAIRAVFDAQNKKKLDKADLPSVTDRVFNTKGSLGSALVRQATAQRTVDTAKGLGGSTPAMDRALQLANQDVNRLRANYVHAKADRAALVAAINQDDVDKNNGLKKAADNAAKAWEDAKNSAMTFHGPGGPRTAKPGANFMAPDLTKAKAAFATFFKQTGSDSDRVGLQVQASMLKINSFVQKLGRAPNKKEVSLILKDVASLSLKNILKLLGLVKPKNVKISQTGGQGVLDIIKNIANEKINDKTFKVIGTIVNPLPKSDPASALNPTTPVLPLPTKRTPASGGVIPGMGGHDSVHAVLQPGEVVLNRSQQYDFGGPEVFKNYFGQTMPGQHFAKGGVVQATRIIGDSPTSSLMIGPKGNIIGDTGTGEGVLAAVTNPITGGTAISPMPNGDAEPGMNAVLALLKNQAPAIKSWERKILWEGLNLDYLHDVTLHDDYDRRSDLTGELANLRGKKDAKGSSYYLNKRTAIGNKQRALAKKIVIDQTSNRHANERLSDYKKQLRVASKVYDKIPGYDAFQGQIEAANNAMTAITYAASQMPALDPAADPNASNGINTLNNAWKQYDSQYVTAGTSERNAIQTRVGWLSTLLPGLAGQPKFTKLVNAETADDQNLMSAILGKSLSDAVPTGVGPGDAITHPANSDPAGTGNNMWADQPLTQQFFNHLSDDIATAAYALITNDSASWNAAMADERDWTWGRLQDLQGVRDNPAYSPWRPDILDEIANDSGNYTSILSAIKGGFASATGSDSGSDDSHLQDVIDDANRIMSQINMGSSVEREQLGLLTDYLRSQVPSFETGTSYVSRDMIAKVHQGEQIIPRGDVAGGAGYAQLELHPTGDSLMDVLIQHIEPKITYKQGQSARRRARERRR